MAKLSSRTKFSPYAVALSLASLVGLGACGEPPDEEPGVTTATGAETNTSGTGDPETTTTGATTEDSTTSGTTTTSGGSGDGPSACGSGDAPFSIVPTAENNMMLTSKITISEVAIAPGSTDITFDWSAVTTDFFKHPVAPTDFVQVTLIPFQADTATIETGINTDDPALEDLADIPAFFYPNKSGTPVTSAKLTDFEDAGYVPVPEDILLDYMNPDKGYVLLFILQAGSGPGVDARIIKAFRPTVGEVNSTVTLDDTSTSLTASATFGSPLSVPAGVSDVSFDYGQLMTRSFGGEFRSEVFEIIVGKYPLGTDLAAGILDIDYVYDKFWRGPGPGVGTSINLSSLKDEAGEAFPGVDASAEYLVGVTCPGCTNPSPWFLTPLQVCP